MFSSRRQPNITRRATAWLLLLICAWMSTAGVLHHTERFAERLAVGGHAAAGLHRQTAAAPLDTCAACQWTQGLLGRTPAACRVPAPLFVPQARQDAAALRLSSPAPIQYSSRAPPSPTAFC